MHRRVVHKLGRTFRVGFGLNTFTAKANFAKILLCAKLYFRENGLSSIFGIRNERNEFCPQFTVEAMAVKSDSQLLPLQNLSKLYLVAITITWIAGYWFEHRFLQRDCSNLQGRVKAAPNPQVEGGASQHGGPTFYFTTTTLKVGIVDQC